jgi:hypothetical protein
MRLALDAADGLRHGAAKRPRLDLDGGFGIP